MTPSPSSRPDRPAYRVELQRDLLRRPLGNVQIKDIRAQADSFDVLLDWSYPKLAFGLARVPWNDIREQKIQRWLTNNQYPLGDISSFRKSPLAPDPRRQASAAPVIPGLDPANILGTIQVQDSEAYLFAKDRIVMFRPDTGGIVWEAELPHGHTAIAFDVSYGLLWVATNSDQGFRDGELGRPFLTTSVYAIAPPTQRDWRSALRKLFPG